MNFVLVFSLSPQIELDGNGVDRSDLGSDEENERLISDNGADTAGGADDTVQKRSLLPDISRESRAIIFKLCCLFAVDSLASGLVPA